MPFERDPVSVQFDAAARRLLDRAYARPGQWCGTYLGQPSMGWRAWAALRGIDLSARDRFGEVRWVRAFKRSVYWNLAWYGYGGGLRDRRRTAPGGARALVWETGKLVMKPGWPARRWAIRVRLVPGGKAAEAAARQLPPGKRYSETAAARSDPAGRDY